MSTPSNKMQELLKFFKTVKGTVAQYTEKALQKAELKTEVKMKIMHLHQGDTAGRLEALKQIQRHTFENIFKKNPTTFFTKEYHYDWWVFPMHIPKSWGWQPWNYDASINKDEAKLLLADAQFVDIYVQCVSMYISALQKAGWNDYPVRYARMLQSLALFLQAANTMSSLGTLTKLNELGADALTYARKYVMPTNKDYELLNNGYLATQSQMEKFATVKEALMTGPEQKI